MPWTWTAQAGAAADQLRALAADLASRAAALAVRLYDLDDTPGLALLREADDWVGSSAALVGDRAGDVDRLWPAWAVLRDGADAVANELDAGNLEGAAARVSATHDPGDGTARDLLDLVDWIEATLGAVEDAAATLSDAWLADQRDVERLRARWSALSEDAGTAGRTHSTRVTAARSEVEAFAAHAAVDPIGAEPAAAEAALAAAEAEVREALATRDGLQARLARAADVVAELRELIPAGAAALARARAKVLEPDGLLEPLDPNVLDEEPLGLAPWLERIIAAAEERWTAAAAGLDRWEAVADVHLANARAVATANSAPVLRRDELRGLLDGLRAKAGAHGLAEDPVTNELHDAAHTLLHVAPCPLVEAEARVEAYRAHVHAATTATGEQAKP